MVFLAALIVLAAGIGQTSVGHAILRETGLYEVPTSYTSLAFLQPQSLPKQLASRRASIFVSFVVRNVNGASRDYQWSLVLDQAQQSRHVAAGRARVASGHGITISRSVEIVCSRGRVRIAVTLVRPAESIDAWATCWSRTP
jgi:hypothetical protein